MNEQITLPMTTGRAPMSQLMDTPSLLTLQTFDIIVASLLVLLMVLGAAQYIYYTHFKKSPIKELGRLVVTMHSSLWMMVVSCVFCLPFMFLFVHFEMYYSAHVINFNLLLALTFSNAIRMNWFGYRTLLLRKNQVS